MKSLTIRGLSIGSGLPKICVPLTSITTEELLAEAALAKAAGADLVEWRADCFGHVTEAATVTACLTALRETLGDLPLLFTFRTAKEGGNRTLDTREYIWLNRLAASTGTVDLLDVELFSGTETVQGVIRFAHSHDLAVIVSNHDFQRTPPKEELLSRLAQMRALGGDIPKIAVTPNQFSDVLTLLSASEEYAATADCPIITISMKELGAISRVAGIHSGSAVTFGITGAASAPGQMAVGELRQIIKALSGTE